MKKKSLLNSILTSSMGMLAAALVVVCLIFSVNVHLQYTQSIKSDLYHTVATESAKMDAWFTRHTTIADGFARAAVHNDLHGDELQQYMLEVVHPCSSSIMNGYLAWETDTVGMVCSIYPVGDNYVAQERGWYKAAKSTKEKVVTDPYIDAITGKIVITVASPLLSDNGTVLGVCGLDIEVSELLVLSQELKADANGYAVLVDASDNIVAHSQNSDYDHKLVGNEEVVTKLLDIGPIYSDVLAAAGSTNVVSGEGYDGIMRYFPVVPIGDTGWKVLYAADYGEAMSQLNNIIIFAIIVSVAVIFGGGAFFYFKFTKRLRPLSDIENIVTNMSNGVLEHNYPAAENDEIGSICHSLEATNLSLKSYINEIGRILANMAAGKFVYDSSLRFAGEFTAMEQSIRGICGAMRSTFVQLGTVSQQIADGSRSVSEGASELAGAASDETRLIGDVHANLEDINTRVSQSSENAFDVKTRAVKATDTVNSGNEKMQELLKIMNSISHYATEIVKMNSTIEDIAFQTNILALNASVEAARAGAAGKGFAVVADEVRNLAAKSREAANSTAELIDRTVKTIESGTAAANAAAQMLGEVVHETSSISKSVSEIADVSEEQKIMLADIVAKLGEVETVIGTTSATAQNAAAASEELDGQVAVLKNNLERYR
ncbi:MAG: hypothetical protein K2K57_04820 [Oscillospiraceae bacterium]|nr:hypothetical protein [Oscillospiraceae bacterium]